MSIAFTAFMLIVGHKIVVVDPGFPRRRAPTPAGSANLLFWPIFPKYYKKLKKKIRRSVGRTSLVPPLLDRPMY